MIEGNKKRKEREKKEKNIKSKFSITLIKTHVKVSRENLGNLEKEEV